MNQQAPLPGFELDPSVPPRPKGKSRKPPREGRDRLLFGLLPPLPVTERLAHLAREISAEYGLKGRPLLNQHFHITLSHLGDFDGLPHDMVESASEVAASIRFAPFDINLDHVLSFKGDTKLPLVLAGSAGVADLMAFQAGLVAALKDAGLPTATGFTPHLTLLYDDKTVIKKQVEPLGWKTDHFVLIHSLLGKTKHLHLSRWPLHV